jgi:DNA repair protein RecN (Recombination protein N)
MLRALSIRQFAIIEQLELEFEPGFTAITGETGAGKSILIDALGQVIGHRADSALIAPGSKQAELSARFELEPGSPALAWLDDQAMAEDHDLLIRRILPTQGSSRAWINGHSATIGQLDQLGRLLIEIHGQHAHQRLTRNEIQRRLVDQQLPGSELNRTRGAFRAWRQARDEHQAFEAEAGDPAQIDLLRFQCRELEDLALDDGEFERLEIEQERLARSDEIQASAIRARTALDGDDGPTARSLLLDAGSALDRVRTLDPAFAAIHELLDEARINIDEVISELERFTSDEPVEPNRLEAINRRLGAALDLARKHRVQPAELPELHRRLENKLEQLDNMDSRRKTLAVELDHALQAWEDAADQLSAARARVAETLAAGVNRRLGELGMDNARIDFDVSPETDADPAAHGRDRVEILFTGNPGQPMRSLSRVASGGELSRVSLALMLAAGPGEGPVSRVFDEVDAGIGGETAHVVGRFLRQAAGAGQTFCVTHLAQVAASADHQLSVQKQHSGETTSIRIETLDPRGREDEIARMLGSAESTKSRAHAREMLAVGRGKSAG